MATLERVQRDMTKLQRQLDLFEDCLGVIERSLKCGLEPNPFYPELQETYERLLRNSRENEEDERERQNEIVMDIEKEMKEMKQLISQLEEENKILQEKVEKQREGKQVLEDLLKQGGSEEVLKAAEELRESYEKCERFLDTNRQRRVIRNVERLKKIMTDGMRARDAAAGVTALSSLAAILLRSHPIGRVIAGAISACSLGFYLSKRKSIEIIWLQIENILNVDAERFASLAKALEEFDQVLQTRFGFSIHSKKFQEICTIFREDKNDVVANSLESGFKDHLSIFSDEKFKATLVWFSKDIVWKNIKVITSSHYFYSVIRALSDFCNNPALQICVPGFFVVCQMFLVVQDYSSDESKLSAVDQGIKRMKEQLKLMEEFVQNSSSSELEDE